MTTPSPFFALTAALLATGCGDDTGSPPVDITDAVFVAQSADCGDYVDRYAAYPTDIQAGVGYEASVVITAASDTCALSSNAIPNHDFNDATGSFAHVVAEVDRSFTISRSPSAGTTTTPITLESFDAVLLNGVVVDLLSAGCYGVGDGTIGCADVSTSYRYDPMFPTNTFGADAHHAHTQPDGTYHYHGDPVAMYDDMPPEEGSPVIGFAADGYPIFGPYFHDGVELRRAISGWELRIGTRPGGPGGDYDGTFIDDYVFTDGGDLDECNGMTVNGQYGYYVTDSYPWILGCFHGTPDASFSKMP